MSIKSVMIVDDSEIDQYILRYMLENLDPSVVILQAHDGQEALDMLIDEQQQPDFILLDINMPRMNGFEFLVEYEKQFQTQTLVIMLSSSEEPIDKEKALAHKCVKNYLSKPMEQSELEGLLA